MNCIKNTGLDKVTDLLIQNNIVGFFQGRSEAGPRALGNRSLLMSPMKKENKDIMNKYKGRELFRPLAASILQQEASKWFDMLGLKESPYMMYAVKTLENKVDLIPAINHVDNTCRIQTLSKDQNPRFYDLIKEFENLTNVPILFNTSFNLAGDCIVETIDDAIHTLKKSKIDCLYVAELGVLIHG